MKLLFYTDLHAADQTPRSRTGDYRADILAKYQAIIALANELQVDLLVNGADTFHQKSSWRVSHWLVKEMIRISQGLHSGCRHVTTIGTHDVPTGRLEKLPQQPLGVMAEAGVIEVLWEPGKDTLVGSDYAIQFIPFSYNLDADPQNYARARPDGARCFITVAHGMVVRPGQSCPFEHTPADKIQTEADLMLYGHPHTPDGIYNVGETAFVGPGSVARLGIYPYNRRVPQVALVTYNEGKAHIELLDLPCRRADEIFAEADADDVSDAELQARMDAFVASIQAGTINESAWTVADIEKELSELTDNRAVKRVALKILEEVS